MFWLRFLISPLTVDGSYKSFALSLAHVRLNLISLRLIPLCSWSLSNPHSAVIIILWTGFKQLCSRCPWVSPHQVDTSRGFVLLWSTKTFLNNYQWLPLWIQWNAMRISTHIALQWYTEVIFCSPHGEIHFGGSPAVLRWLIEIEY